MSYPASAAIEQPEPMAIKAIAALAGLVGLGVLVQAATGGVVARQNRNGFVNAHSGLSYLVAVLALAAVVVAVMKWRGRAGGTVVLYETIGLLVAVIMQIGIGQQIGDSGKVGSHPGLLAIHVPLGLIVFGLALHLSTFVSNIRRIGA